MSIIITNQILASLNSSVLCWLATSSDLGQPNVSPKEIFTWFDDHILIANIASPNSVKNIRKNNLVSLSFIDVLIQKGYQLHGEAQIIDKKDESFATLSIPLLEMTLGKYPFSSIFKIFPKSVKPILAPSYIFYPEIPESEKIKQAKKQYNIN